MSTFNHALCLFEHDACNLDVAFGWFVECRGNNLGVYCARHIGNLLWAFVDEQHHKIRLRVISCDGIGYILHKDSLTCLRLSHNKGTLSLAYRREQVYNASAEICCLLFAAKVELLFWEQWCEMLKRYSVANIHRLTAVNHIDACQREVLLAVMGWANMTLDNVAGLQTIVLNLLGRYIYIIRR